MRRLKVVLQLNCHGRVATSTCRGRYDACLANEARACAAWKDSAAMRCPLDLISHTLSFKGLPEMAFQHTGHPAHAMRCWPAGHAPRRSAALAF